jgi:hypothetical protein
VIFPFAPNNERDILVSLQSLTSTDTTNTQTALLPQPIYAYIDSTIAEIWLPLEACLLFEQAFGIKYDATTELYLVPDNVHNQLLVTNPNITFNIAPWTQQTGHTDNVNIVLPYSAFDLTAKSPYQNLNHTTRYFPLRRAENDTQFTIGRTFLQEAYLTVDWERQNFSVSQVNWVAGAKSNVVPIYSLNQTSNGTIGGANGGANGGASKMAPLSTGAIAGIAVGVVFILLVTAGMAFLFFPKKPAKTEEPNKTVDTESSKDEEATGTTLVFPKAELPAEDVFRAEVDGTFFGKNALGRVDTSSSTAALVESDSKEREVFEMEGDMPSRQEADGRQLTEKDAMKAREERINGVDTHNSPVSNENQSPTSLSPPSTLDSNRRRGLLTPGDVIELSPIDGRTHLPISPLDGSEGSHTNLFSALSPISPGGTTSSGGVSPDTARKRFSYEDP